MGWFKKLTKKVSAAATTVTGGRTKIGKKVSGAVKGAAKTVTGVRAVQAGVRRFKAGKATRAATRANAAADAAADEAIDKAAEDKAAADKVAADKAAADKVVADKSAGAEALRAKLGLSGPAARPADTGTGATKTQVFTPGARTSWRGGRKTGSVSTITTGTETVQGGSVLDPAVLAAQEEEKKKKAALLAAQQAAAPKTLLG